MADFQYSHLSSTESDSLNNSESNYILLKKKHMEKEALEKKELFERIRSIENSIKLVSNKIDHLSCLVVNKRETPLSNMLRNKHESNPMSTVKKYPIRNRKAKEKIETVSVPKKRRRSASNVSPAKKTSRKVVRSRAQSKNKKKSTMGKNRASCSPTKIETFLKEFELVITVQLNSNELRFLEHNLPFQKYNERVFFLKKTTKFMARNKLTQNDQLQAINGVDVSEGVGELIGNLEGVCTLTFKCSRVLTLSKLFTFKGREIDPEKLNKEVDKLGGFNTVIENKLWQTVRRNMKLPTMTSGSTLLKKSYIAYFSGILL